MLSLKTNKERKTVSHSSNQALMAGGDVAQLKSIMLRKERKLSRM